RKPGTPQRRENLLALTCVGAPAQQPAPSNQLPGGAKLGILGLPGASAQQLIDELGFDPLLAQLEGDAAPRPAPGAPAGERLPGEATIVDDTRLLVAFNQRVDPMGDLGLRRKVRSLALASQARSAAPK